MAASSADANLPEYIPQSNATGTINPGTPRRKILSLFLKSAGPSYVGHYFFLATTATVDINRTRRTRDGIIPAISILIPDCSA